jgi:hypothetical protein
MKCDEFATQLRQSAKQIGVRAQKYTWKVARESFFVTGSIARRKELGINKVEDPSNIEHFERPTLHQKGS